MFLNPRCPLNSLPIIANVTSLQSALAERTRRDSEALGPQQALDRDFNMLREEHRLP